MANLAIRAKPPKTTIDTFLGLNEDTTGETQLKLGQSPDMQNFRVTENFKLKKIEGYEELFDSLGSSSIQSVWYGEVGNTSSLFFAHSCSIYSCDVSNGTYSVVGTITAGTPSIFNVENNLYMLNGTDYKYYNGTTFGDVLGYVPTLYINSPPTGGGTAYEEENYLTASKKQWFSGDGSSTVFILAESNIDSIQSVKDRVTGQLMTPSTYSLTVSSVTFSSPPSDLENNIEVQWKKETSGNRNQILNCKYSMNFGSGNDTSVFLWGNDNYKNRRYHSGLVSDLLSAEYFPIYNRADIGIPQHAITDIVRQYDRQLIFTNAPDTYYSYFNNDSYPIYPLNSRIGNVSPNQVQLVLNNPFAITKGIYEFVSSSVKDERNAVYKSKCVQPSLDEVDLRNAITIDWEEMGEYWLAVGTTVWVYNYRNDTWYKFKFAHTPTCFIVIDGSMYFGTSEGQIMKFDNDLRSFNGTAINAYWHMHFYDFEAEYLYKFLNNLWVSLKPEQRAKVQITWQTDKGSSTTSQTLNAIYNLATFEHADFAHWSFATNYNPQPFAFEMDIDEFTYLKLILTNNSDAERATVLSINMDAQFGGEIE